jgi:DNA modification methylase
MSKVELLLGDCLDVMRGMKDKSVNAVITDPPYGIKRDKGFEGFEGFGGFGSPIARKQYHGDWDNKRPSKIYFDEILRISKTAFIFGGNYFTDYLPVGNHWIVWDKLNTMPTFGDCELVWTNVKRNSVKKITREYNGLLGKEDERYHATQKPIDLMTRLITNYIKDLDAVIFDPFAGSGTTLIAGIRLGYKNLIGVEKDEQYFAIAQKRIRDALQQPLLFEAIQ